jgi:hypothetical protein
MNLKVFCAVCAQPPAEPSAIVAANKAAASLPQRAKITMMSPHPQNAKRHTGRIPVFRVRRAIAAP